MGSHNNVRINDRKFVAIQTKAEIKYMRFSDSDSEIE